MTIHTPEQTAVSAEDIVVDSIRHGVAKVSAASGFGKVSSAVRGIGAFGKASGGLLQTWLTPQARVYLRTQYTLVVLKHIFCATMNI